MTPTAYVFTIFFIHLGIVLVATSYFAFSAALAPRITHRARVRFAMRPWLPILIGVSISVPWVVIGLVLLNNPIAGLKFAGAVMTSAWVLLGLIGGAGVAQHIGRPRVPGDAGIGRGQGFGRRVPARGRALFQVLDDVAVDVVAGQYHLHDF